MYRLDITIQHSFSHIVDFYLVRVALGTKTNIVFQVNRVYVQKVTRNAKSYFEYLKIIRTYLFYQLLQFLLLTGAPIGVRPARPGSYLDFEK